MSDLLLTPDELVELTGGLTQGAAQARFIRKHYSFHVFMGADRQPKVLRSAFDEWSSVDARDRRELQQHVKSKIGQPRKPLARPRIVEIRQARPLPIRIGPPPEPKLPHVPLDSAAHSRERQLRIRRATPPWANRGLIRAIYAKARILTGESGVEHHVDHEIPLCGKTVSGLHVETNLRILTATDNVRRPRKYMPCS